MQKYGNFWVPRSDTRGLKNKRKMANLFGKKDGSIDPLLHALETLKADRPDLYHPDATAIDGGANVGSYTRVLLKNFERVVCFEPSRDTYQCLERNVHSWGDFHRAHLLNAAVSNEWGYVSLKHKLFRLSMTAQVERGGDISAIPIDALELEKVGFLKLDVEGYELNALKGADQTITRCKPVIFMEVKPEEEELSEAPYAAHKHVLSKGYEVVQELGLNWVYYPKA